MRTRFFEVNSGQYLLALRKTDYQESEHLKKQREQHQKLRRLMRETLESRTARAQ